MRSVMTTAAALTAAAAMTTLPPAAAGPVQVFEAPGGPGAVTFERTGGLDVLPFISPDDPARVTGREASSLTVTDDAFAITSEIERVERVGSGATEAAAGPLPGGPPLESRNVFELGLAAD